MKGKVSGCPFVIERRKKALENFLRANHLNNPEIVKVDLVRGTARIAFNVSLLPEKEKNGQ